MRNFLLEEESSFEKQDIISKNKVSNKNFLKEINFLTNLGFLKKKKIKKEREGGKKKYSVIVWQIDPTFKYLSEFKNLLTSVESLKKEEILKKINKAGKIKFLATSGIFMNNKESSADLLIVGDKINKKQINNIIKKIEIDIGRELRYGVFETDDFKYRITVYDKFVRDILDFPHEKILDRLND